MCMCTGFNSGCPVDGTQHGTARGIRTRWRRPHHCTRRTMRPGEAQWKLSTGELGGLIGKTWGPFSNRPAGVPKTASHWLWRHILRALLAKSGRRSCGARARGRREASRPARTGPGASAVPECGLADCRPRTQRVARPRTSKDPREERRGRLGRTAKPGPTRPICREADTRNGLQRQTKVRSRSRKDDVDAADTAVAGRTRRPALKAGRPDGVVTQGRASADKEKRTNHKSKTRTP